MSAPPRVVPLTDEIQPAVLDYLRGAVYRNALLIANASQVRSRCDVIAALDGPAVVGVASTYSDLPLTNLTFAADSEDIASRLLETLVERNQRLGRCHLGPSPKGQVRASAAPRRGTGK